MRIVLFALLSLLLLSCHAKDENKVKAKETFAPQSYPVYAIPEGTLPYSKVRLKIFKKSYLPKIEKFYDDYWVRNDLSGGFLVAKNGVIIYEKYRGYANKEEHITISKNTPIHLASISKVLTAVAILRLVEEKEIRLEQYVSHILPTFPYKEITVRDLLTHRSGLQNYAYYQANEKYWPKGKMKTNDDVLKYIAQELSQINSQPNQKFSYCNTNYTLLALIIEKITKQTYPEAMQHIVFEPFGMQNTFVYQPKDHGKVSKSYTAQGLEWAEGDMDLIYGDKNIYSTPRDLLKLDKAMYADNFLTPQLRQQMKTGYSNEHKGVKNYGLGIRMMQWENGDKLLYHNGWWHGNNTSYSRNEKDTITVIALGNKKNGAFYKALALAGTLGNYPIKINEEEK